MGVSCWADHYAAYAAHMLHSNSGPMVKKTGLVLITQDPYWIVSPKVMFFNVTEPSMKKVTRKKMYIF